VRDELLNYYERELAYLRRLGVEFAQKYPKVASRLQLEQSRCEDPHVERLLEGFAFLAARLHLKIDDEFPELTQSLLGILFPHFIRPLPSMTIAEFHIDAQQGQMTTAMRLPRGSALLAKPVHGYRCQFRTCTDLDIWPIKLTEAQWTTPERLDPPVKSSDTAYALRLRLESGPNTNFGSLGIKSLQLHLHGEAGIVCPLYELLGNNTKRILVRDVSGTARGRAVTLAPSRLVPFGFEDDEAMLPYPKRSFTGYRLLQEYFSFPEKFHFYRLEGLDELSAIDAGQAIEVVFLMSPCERADWEPVLQLGVSTQTVRLNCVTAINLFPHTADPIMVDQTKPEYPVVPDARRRDMLEVFSIESVVATNPKSMEVIEFEPFYSYRHAGKQQGGERLFWHAVRRESAATFDGSTELMLQMVDLEGRSKLPEYDTLTVRCLCTNRELPQRLPLGNEQGDFDLEGANPFGRIVALRKPTNTIRPAMGSAAFWRLISHMSLNYLSIVEEGKEALQEILRLYAPLASGSFDRQIDGLSAVESKRQFARVASEAGLSFVRGTRVTVTLDEEYFVGAGAFIFGSVLERFLGLYTSLNSFSQLELRGIQRKRGMIRRWPARAGQGILL
jgi:type VI secretion system protein ImpG